MRKVTIGKFFKSSVMGACILALFFVGSLFIIASGGGGDDGGSAAPAESASLSDIDADVAADVAMQAVNMAGPSAAMGGIDLNAVGTDNNTDSPMRSVIDQALALSRSASAQLQGKSAPFAVEPCLGGGTMDVPELTQQQIAQALLSGSLSVTADYDNCVEGTETMDGTMTIRMTGNLLALDFDNLTITTAYFQYQNSATSENITMTGYQMITDSMVFAGEELSSAVITITGDVAGLADGQTIDASFHQLAIQFQELTGGESISINGMINNNCIGGWATISTATDIFVPTGVNDCPTAGDISVTSGDDTVRAFVDQSDDLIDIHFNGSPAFVDLTCANIEGTCIN